MEDVFVAENQAQDNKSNAQDFSDPLFNNSDFVENGANVVSTESDDESKEYNGYRCAKAIDHRQ